jgi:hypothetical protein
MEKERGFGIRQKGSAQQELGCDRAENENREERMQIRALISQKEATREDKAAHAGTRMGGTYESYKEGHGL